MVSEDHRDDFFWITFIDSDDIGYIVLVSEDGNVYTGHGLTNVSAHTVGYHSKSIGWSLCCSAQWI